MRWQSVLVPTAIVLLLFLTACSSGGSNDAATPVPTATAASSTQSTPAATTSASTGAGANQTGASAPTGTSSSQASGSTSAGSSASSGDVGKVVEAWSKVKNFRATMTIDSQGTKVEGTIEVVLPDKEHLKISGTPLGMPGDVEIITIGSDYYINIGGVWAKQSLGTAFDASEITNAAEAIKDIATNSTKGGTDSVNGKTCQIYTEDDGSGGTTEYCIADNLPVRIVSGDTTIVFTDYNADISIKAPI